MEYNLKSASIQEERNSGKTGRELRNQIYRHLDYCPQTVIPAIDLVGIIIATEIKGEEWSTFYLKRIIRILSMIDLWGSPSISVCLDENKEQIERGSKSQTRLSMIIRQLTSDTLV
jgi:hypothetical protein